MALKFDSDLQDYLIQCAGAQQCDERLVCGRSTLPEWHKEGIISDLLKAVPEACKLSTFPKELSDPVFALDKPQKPATAILHKALHTKKMVLDVFKKRILHWVEEADDGIGTLDGLAELVFDNFEKMGKLGIPHLRTAYLKTVCNSWATSTRHGLPPLDCLCGCKIPAKDSLSHYMACPFFYVSIHLMFPHLPILCNVTTFLGMYEMSRVDVCCLMLAIDALHYVYNFIGHSQVEVNNWPRIPIHIRQRVLFTLSKSPNLKKAVSQRVNLDPVWGNDPFDGLDKSVGCSWINVC